MKKIRPSSNKARWPRNRVKSVECRSRDLVFRITDWLSDKDEPGFHVETYVGGVYDYNLSECFTLYSLKTPTAAKAAAIKFVQNQVSRLL